MVSSSSPRRNGPDRRLIGVGLVAGAAVGAWVTAQARSRPADAPPGLIDWTQAAGIATNLNRGEILGGVDRERLDAAYRDLVAVCVPIVGAYMEVEIASPVERTFAFDRVDWINANIEGFQRLLRPLEEIGLGGEGARSVAAFALGGVNRTIVSAEMGLLLGYLAKKVLGQYDLALLGGETDGPGKLYYVEPNIRMVESTLNLPPEQFRLWLALHETTHVFEFEGFPWVRPYFQGLLNEYFEFMKADVEVLRNGLGGLRVLAGRVRANDGDDRSWIEALMTPDQRAIFDRIQAVMCVVEGYSNHVMNAVGRDLMTDFDGIARRFEQRQRQKGIGEQLFARITGLNLKMEQYRLGERFVNAVVEERGKSAALRMWSSPEAMPSMAEIRDPSVWIARVLDAAGATAANGSTAERYPLEA